MKEEERVDLCVQYNRCNRAEGRSVGADLSVYLRQFYNSALHLWVREEARSLT